MESQHVLKSPSTTYLLSGEPVRTKVFQYCNDTGRRGWEDTGEEGSGTGLKGVGLLSLSVGLDRTQVKAKMIHSHLPTLSYVFKPMNLGRVILIPALEFYDPMIPSFHF